MKSKDETARQPPRRKGIRHIDEADEIAERLYDMVRDALNESDDQKVIDAIAAEIRKAAQGPRKMGVLR